MDNLPQITRTEVIARLERLGIPGSFTDEGKTKEETLIKAQVLEEVSASAFIWLEFYFGRRIDPYNRPEDIRLWNTFHGLTQELQARAEDLRDLVGERAEDRIVE